MSINQYLLHIKDYIKQNTPVEFIYHDDKYIEIKNRMLKENIDRQYHDLICASYTLFYSSLSYHNQAVEDNDNRSYNILLGDFICSYVAEKLYENGLFSVLKAFAESTKQMMLNILNNDETSDLLDNIINALKER